MTNKGRPEDEQKAQDRLEFINLMESMGWNAAETARQIGRTRSNISQILDGKISARQALQILRLKIEAKLHEAGGLRYDDPKFSGLTLTDHGGPYWGTSTQAPIVSPAAAGVGREFLDAGADAPHVHVNCKDPNCYCLIVWGDSMEPIYRAGDILVIAPGMQVYPNDLVVFKTSDNEPFFKKYLGMQKGRHRFASLNPNYEMMVKDPDEVLKVHPVHSVIRPLKGKLF